jgi:hypothetical protein
MRMAAAFRGARPAPWDSAAVELDRVRRQTKDIIIYPNYLYGLLAAARTARAAGESEFSAIEFGVAGGTGMVQLERHALIVEQLYGVKIRTFGFDLGSGLPRSSDPRDCPFALRSGEFAMDLDQLKGRLSRSELLIGDVRETVVRFCETPAPPVGFVSNDLDLYSSTRASFALFGGSAERLLPRVMLYFDDITGYPYTTVTGEWAAINDFNASHSDRQIGYIFGLKHSLGSYYRFAPWAESFFILHVFDHPKYAAPEETEMPDLRLRN